MIAIQRITLDMINLLFPAICNGCGTHLSYGEKEICIKCLYQLPYTDYHLYDENRVAKQFWARLPVNAAMAMLYFKKGTKVQNLIHRLKYEGQTKVGEKLGALLGERLASSIAYQHIDLIIPVPLHPARKRARGYNQSESIASGVAEVLQVPVGLKNLKRVKSTDSQTKKSRYIRHENMQTIFNVQNKEQIKNLHVLLIDDVITTGATLEACGNALLSAGIKKLSIATVAFAE